MEETEARVPNFDDPLDIRWLNDHLREVARDFGQPREDRVEVATKALIALDDQLRDHALLGLMAERVDKIFAVYAAQAVSDLHALSRPQRPSTHRPAYGSGAPSASDNQARSRLVMARTSVDAILNRELGVPNGERRWDRKRLGDLTADMLESIAQHRDTLGNSLKAQARRLRQIAQVLQNEGYVTAAELPRHLQEEIVAIAEDERAQEADAA